MKITRRQLRRIVETFAATAEEEAEKVNAQTGISLVTDQAFWEEMGVSTGEELAKSLLSSTYSDYYKDLHGIRPRWMADKIKSMSVEEIQTLIDDLDKEAETMAADEKWEEENLPGWEDEMLAAVKAHPEDVPKEYLEYETLPQQTGMGRRTEGIMRITRRQLRRIIREEVLRPRLNEATEMLTSKNGSKVVFADWTKKHIEGGHKEPGKGSIFADFDLSKIADAVSKIDVSGDGGVYQLPIPGVGYDLVRPMDQAKKLKGANIIDVEKEERQGKITVKGVETSQSLEDFKSDVLSVVIRPTKDLQYVPDDVKDQVVDAFESETLYSVLSSWPGEEAPRASEWKDKWAVVIPGKVKTEGARRNMKITRGQLKRIIREERARLIEQSAGNRQLNVKFVEQSNAYDQTEWVFSLNGEEIEVLSSGTPSADFLAEDIVSRWGEDQDPPVDETPAFEGLVDDVERQLLASPGFADALEDAAAAVEQYAQDQYGEEW